MFGLWYNHCMKRKFAEQVAERVKASYSQFAEEFDLTRRQQWPEFGSFSAYVKTHARVLDLGCGNGRFYDFLKSKKISYLGIDHNSHLLSLACKNFPEACFQLDDLMDLKLEKESFDNIFCIAVFHHIPTKKMRHKVLKDIHRALKSDGILILTVWNLFQFKYLRTLLRGMIRYLFTLGLKEAWNDLWIRWGNYPLKRYYHAFLPKELLALFDPDLWKIEEFYFTRKGKRVTWFRSFNLVLIVRKK